MDQNTNPKKVEKTENIEGIYAFVSKRADDVASEIYERISDMDLDKGGIFMVVGPKKSGKSMMAIKLHEFFVQNKLRNRKSIFAQPTVDRPDVPKDKIFSRIGKEIVATSFESILDIEKIFHDNEVVVVDEIQFVPAELQSYLLHEIKLFVERGGVFVGLGLDYTSQGGEFVFSALLESRSEKVFRMSSLCQMCGRRADRYGQRLINGIPAEQDSPAFLSPSINVTYEPRCDECFVVKK